MVHLQALQRLGLSLSRNGHQIASMSIPSTWKGSAFSSLVVSNDL
ncbi:hypothetical protein OIU78_002989, partial [Salix suchowensis]